VRTPHFRVSTDQFVPGGMKGIDSEHEEGLVSKSVCLSLERFDLVVGSFQGSGGNPMIVVSEDALFVGAQGFGNILEYADAR